MTKGRAKRDAERWGTDEPKEMDPRQKALMQSELALIRQAVEAQHRQALRMLKEAGLPRPYMVV